MTALYQIEPGVATADSRVNLRYQAVSSAPKLADEWGAVSLRYQPPEGGQSQLIEESIAGQPAEWTAATHSSRFATATALFGMLLRDSEYTGDATYATVRELALVGALDERQSELVKLLSLVQE